MYAFDSEIKYISRKNLLPIYFKEKSMKILATIKAALKKAGIPEKYAAKVQALFDIESEENLDNYIGLFKDNILPDLVSNEQGNISINILLLFDFEEFLNLYSVLFVYTCGFQALFNSINDCHNDFLLKYKGSKFFLLIYFISESNAYICNYVKV